MNLCDCFRFEKLPYTVYNMESNAPFKPMTPFKALCNTDTVPNAVLLLVLAVLVKLNITSQHHFGLNHPSASV